MTSGEFFDWQTSGGGGDILRLAEAWRQAGVKWCVIGGLAVNHWAKEPLVTKDAEIVTAFSDLALALEAARAAEFSITAFRFSANLQGKGDISIQVTTDPRYSGFAERASDAEVFGMTLDLFSDKPKPHPTASISTHCVHATSAHAINSNPMACAR